MASQVSPVATLLMDNEEKILAEWVNEQARRLGGKISLNELKTQCKDFLRLLTSAMQSALSANRSLADDSNDSLEDGTWGQIKKILSEMSRSRGLKGFSPTETATFVFSLKKPLFALLRKEYGQNGDEMAEHTWMVSSVIDRLGLYVTENYMKTREELILRQQADMLELSTPVVKLWDGILALPMIGTLDSSRTQVVMESLLQKIMDTGSEVAIIDITGVPTVDTLVAQHLIKTVTAAKLMGAECIISGIRPQIAATIVHLGVDLGGVATKASLADAFVLALKKTGKAVGRSQANEAGTARK